MNADLCASILFSGIGNKHRVPAPIDLVRAGSVEIGLHPQVGEIALVVTSQRASTEGSDNRDTVPSQE
ncbi:MAG TPA: hypothetical protein VG848_02100 [Acetobacteraceae bacterium]|nr:hypothetical protein [Acetobacteraceae bacterium]